MESIGILVIGCYSKLNMSILLLQFQLLLVTPSSWLTFQLMKRLLRPMMVTLLQEQKEIILNLSGIIYKVAQLAERYSPSLLRSNFLSCNALTIMTLQLPACFTHVAFWRVASRKSLVRSSRENPPMHTHLNFFTLSNTQPLHYSHLNIRYLIAKLQANLAWNKANT